MSLVNGRNQIFIKQVFAAAELFGFEARNKYEIFDAEKRLIGYAAEQQKNLLGFLLRQGLRHWRVFSISVFNANRELNLRIEHPFRFFFQRLEVHDAAGKFLGALQKRFSILSKRFDVEDANGNVVMEVASPIWRLWTFPFIRGGQDVATVSKRWSGVLTEVFTNRDNFLIEFQSPTLSETDRNLILAAGLYIDLEYFEEKTQSVVSSQMLGGN